jgi:hypothetical protein
MAGVDPKENFTAYWWPSLETAKKVVKEFVSSPVLADSFGTCATVL